MNIDIPSNVQLFEMSYGDDFPADQYYIVLFKRIASRFELYEHYDLSVLTFFYNNGFKIIHKFDVERKQVRQNLKLIVLANEEKRMLVLVNIDKDKNEELATLTYLYDWDLGVFQTQLNINEIRKHKKEKKKSNINLVISDHGHLDTEEYDVAVPEMDLELNYGAEFLKIHDKIIKRLNTDRDKGIILLHGDPGTGKTSYLKYLTKFITNKDILFIPPSMAEMLAEPSIIPFLMDKRNNILLIEDAEKVISDRKTSGSSATGVSNLLNLTDGILGDCLNIQVIATFNMKREKIDDALLRKGRLIAEHKFEKLSVENTNRLLKHLNKSYTSDIGLTLADIYNIEDDEIRVTSESKKIGFRN